MDPSVLRSHIYSQQGMAPSTLASGQSYYTLESLEGASSLPFLKPPPGSVSRRESMPSSMPPPFERLDAQARALVADRELLDARARLLVAEREALLRNVPGGATERVYADGFQATDARGRFAFDGLQNADVRGRAHLENRALSHGFDAHHGIPSLADHRTISHGFDMRPHDPLQPGVGNMARALPIVGGFAQGASQNSSLSELLRAREPGVGNPFGPVADPALAQGASQNSSLRFREPGVGNPFVPVADPALARRDSIANWRAEIPNVGAQHVHPIANGSRELPFVRFGLPEANKVKFQTERNKAISTPQPKPPAPKVKVIPEQSEGWCAVCKIDCVNAKTLSIHASGRKHRALVQGNNGKADTASTAPSTSQAGKKRATDEKTDLTQIAKRLKFSSNTAPSTPAIKTKVEAQKVKPTPPNISKPPATSVSKPPATNKSDPSELVCTVCNITTTGKANLESHMKGKRHAARVKELANPQLVGAA